MQAGVQLSMPLLAAAAAYQDNESSSVSEVNVMRWQYWWWSYLRCLRKSTILTTLMTSLQYDNDMIHMGL